MAKKQARKKSRSKGTRGSLSNLTCFRTKEC
jgi:hypothetical protein